MKIINNQNLPEIINSFPEITEAGKGTVTPKRNPKFSIPKWSFLIFNYHGKIKLEDEEFEYCPGCAFFTSPKVLKHHFPYEKSFHYFVHMTFEEDTSTEMRYLFMDLEESYSSITKTMNEILIFRNSDIIRAQVKLWDILQSFKDVGGSHFTNTPLLLQKALEYIEAHIGTEIDIAELSNRLNVSQSYLIRLFRKHQSNTIIGYIRKRRMELARSMLINSDMPIKNIAWETGIPDLQYFNKSIRAEFGIAPSKLRKEYL